MPVDHNKPKVTYVCGNIGCHSLNVRRDAWAVWESTKQEWVLNTVFDAAFCERCDGPTELIEVPIEGGE